MHFPTRLNWLPCSVAVVGIGTALAGGARQVRADATIVTETTTQTDIVGANLSDLGDIGDFAKPFTISISYSKGKLSRYDAQDRIILRGLQEGTISVLNPAQQTYYVTTEADEYARKSGGSSSSSTLSSMDGVNFNPTATITNVHGTRSILGLSAHGAQYAIGLSAKFPKGAVDVPDYFRFSLRGEVWVSRAVPFLPGDVTVDSMPSTIPKQFRAVLSKISDKVQGNPLSMQMVFHLEAGDKDHKVKLNVVLRQNVRAISHAPLSDDVFRVPEGYRLVQAPAKTPAPAAAAPAPAPGA